MSNGGDRLTFSQRVGKSPLPEPMRLEYLPRRFRILLWQYFDEAIEHSNRGPSIGNYSDPYTRSDIRKVIHKYFIDVRHQPHDGMEHTISDHKEFLRPLLLHGEYHEVLTLIEYVLENTNNNHHPIIRTLVGKLLLGFKLVNIAYTVQIIQKLPTIVPRINLESGEATTCAIETVEKGGPEGAKTHLNESVENINAQRYADSVRDSIHAVESVARTIDPRASTKLGPALTSLSKAGVLKHSVLKEALEKLYGYTNSEEGIRHPLLEEGAADVDLDDALFMFSACAAFSAYLLNRHQQVRS